MTKSGIRAAVAAACLAAASSAMADLRNISTTTLASSQDGAIACSIVGTDGVTWRGLKVMMVFAEAAQSGSNPWLKATLLENGETAVNDTWTGQSTYNGQVMQPLDPATYRALLRTPYGSNDAALLVSLPKGWRLCAEAKEVSSGSTLRRVAVSITDVTDNVVSILKSANLDINVDAEVAKRTNWKVSGAAAEALQD